MKQETLNPNKTDTFFSTIVLASGLSERMGQPKAMLKWDESRTFLEKIISEYLDAGCGRVICLVNHLLLSFCESLEKNQRVKFILNRHPDRGRMYSIRLGLEEVKDSPFSFIQNVDNPYIHSGIIRKIFSERDSGSWCSPVFGSKSGHPVLLPQMIMERILNKEEMDPAMTLNQILHLFPKKIVEMEDDSVLKNINTQEDYRDFLNSKQILLSALFEANPTTGSKKI